MARAWRNVPRLVGLVESLIGKGDSVYFSQIFFKPPRGGVSFHHGTTFHQSGANLSPHWCRACALHSVRNDNPFVEPALECDHSIVMRVS